APPRSVVPYTTLFRSPVLGFERRGARHRGGSRVGTRLGACHGLGRVGDESCRGSQSAAGGTGACHATGARADDDVGGADRRKRRSEEHTSELQSLTNL